MNGGELVEQLAIGRHAGHDLLEGSLEGTAEEIGEGLARLKAFFDGGSSDLEVEFGSREVKISPGRVGLMEEGGDDHEQESPPSERSLTLNNPTLASQLIELGTEIFL